VSRLIERIAPDGVGQAGRDNLAPIQPRVDVADRAALFRALSAPRFAQYGVVSAHGFTLPRADAIDMTTAIRQSIRRRGGGQHNLVALSGLSNQECTLG
jgi:hypothetical protein